MKTLYHGTSSKNVDSIKRLGLLPDHVDGADSWAKIHDKAIANLVNRVKREPSVFVTDNPDIAATFAHFASEVVGGKPAIIKFSVPASVFSKFTPDEAYSPINFLLPKAWRGPGIEPVYITSVTTS